VVSGPTIEIYYLTGFDVNNRLPCAKSVLTPCYHFMASSKPYNILLNPRIDRVRSPAHADYLSKCSR
jgi:hypothetical protein